MPRDGNGTYVRTDGTYTGADVFQQEEAAGVDIEALNLDTEAQDMADALTQSLSKDGQTDPTANLPMAGFKHTNVDSADSRTDYARTDQVQDDAFTWLDEAGGTADALTFTCSPVIASYVAGQRWRFIAASANTGAVTANICGVGARSVKDQVGAALAANFIKSGGVYEMTDTGTELRLYQVAASDTTSGIQQNATVAEMLAASATNRTTVAGRIKYSPYASKATGFINTTTPATPAVDYGVGITSCARNSSGNYTITLADTYASTGGGRPKLSPFVTPYHTGANLRTVKVFSTSTTTFRVIFESKEGNAEDPDTGFFIDVKGELA